MATSWSLATRTAGPEAWPDAIALGKVMMTIATTCTGIKRIRVIKFDVCTSWQKADMLGEALLALPMACTSHMSAKVIRFGAVDHELFPPECTIPRVPLTT
ncbi:hypothetical protein PG994_005653 [Apiospora phragmitis]|uniref:Uncharacterized protein n=1 Tax=Apiospora phragmitis TaxID=2905665 RepID=A0ABR1VDU6_9PEZI